MSRSLFVHFLPDLLEPSDLSGHTAVVIDVLRASSTIATAVAAGVRQIIPCQSVDQAFQIRQEQQAGDASSVLLGGERGGMKIDGFDLSNSPQDYSAARVANRTIAFTTTNGTRAMSHCVAARRILVGAFVNLQAVCEELVAGNDDVHLVCAGTDGKPTAEDILFAGAVCDCLLAPEDADHDWNLSDSARIACLSWRQAAGNPEAGNPEAGKREAANSSVCADRIEAALLQSQGGRNLQRLGFHDDIRLCSQPDSVSVVPVCLAVSGEGGAVPSLMISGQRR